MAKYIALLAPHCKIEQHEQFVNEADVPRYFPDSEQPPDFVLDCIDNIDAKVALIKFCVERKIKLITSCGAGFSFLLLLINKGLKADPTRVQIRDLSETTCKLFSSLLYYLSLLINRRRPSKSDCKCASTAF